MPSMKLFHTIPGERPSIPLLEGINSPYDMRSLHRDQLRQVADELREYLLYCVGISGGHFGAGLGVVELTVALHFCLDTPFDQLVWDVGHQAYPHKVLTGRREQLTTIRKEGGLAAFPDREEEGVLRGALVIQRVVDATVRDTAQDAHHLVVAADLHPHGRRYFCALELERFAARFVARGPEVVVVLDYRVDVCVVRAPHMSCVCVCVFLDV